MTPDLLRELLRRAKTIAVVGLSPNPDRPSHEIATYLKERGYRVVPVNPGQKEILGQKCYPSLAAAAAEHSIDVVDVFRKSEQAGAVVDEAIAIRPRLIWLQIGVVDDAARRRAEAAGIPCVMDRCIKIDHRALGL
ncbi:MAG TPA: CoA-binding protein [Gemmatimonadales bacterium]|nr:CoA-binding protein [Gemmatimonadales bacterium]